MSIPYFTSSHDGVETIVAYNADEEHALYSAHSTHPNFEQIRLGLDRGDTNVFALFDVVGGVNSRLGQVSDRITFDGENVFWDGDKVDSVVFEYLKRLLRAGGGRDAAALAKFIEKLETNPNEHSRTMAYQWLASHDFKITEDGDVVAYKGVTNGGLSTRRGHAFVDGKEFTNSQIPYEDGTVVTMPRSEVAHDPNAACHTGLHIGDWGFAKGFGSTRTKMVTFSPRDIVSVPGAASKARVCRLKVIRDVEVEADSGPVLKEADLKSVVDVSISAL